MLHLSRKLFSLLNIILRLLWPEHSILIKNVSRHDICIKRKEQIVTMVREARGTNKKRKRLNGGERKAVDPCMEEDLLDGYAI